MLFGTGVESAGTAPLGRRKATFWVVVRPSQSVEELQHRLGWRQETMFLDEGFGIVLPCSSV